MIWRLSNVIEITKRIFGFFLERIANDRFIPENGNVAKFLGY